MRSTQRAELNTWLVLLAGFAIFFGLFALVSWVTNPYAASITAGVLFMVWGIRHVLKQTNREE